MTKERKNYSGSRNKQKNCLQIQTSHGRHKPILPRCDGHTSM